MSGNGEQAAAAVFTMEQVEALIAQALAAKELAIRAELEERQAAQLAQLAVLQQQLALHSASQQPAPQTTPTQQPQQEQHAQSQEKQVTAQGNELREWMGAEFECGTEKATAETDDPRTLQARAP